MHATQRIAFFLLTGLLAMTSFAAAETTSPPVTPATQATPAAAKPVDITGTYKCSGYDPYDKTNYTESIVIKKTGDAYSVQLIHSDSVVPYNLGTAVFNKNIKNAVGLVYWDPQRPTTMGTELFEIKPDGTLDGVWTSSGTKWLGTETCTKG